MEHFTDLAKQIQDQASTSKSQLDQYVANVKAEMNAFKEENDRRILELDRQVDEYINKMVEEYKPDPEKIVAFRKAKAEIFKEMLVETEQELESLASKMKSSMDPLKISFEQSVSKVSTFMKQSQDIIAKTVDDSLTTASSTKEKCEKVINEHKKQIYAIKNEAENFAKSAKEMAAQILEEAKAKSKALAEKNQKKFEALMKQLEDSMKSSKLK